MPKFDRAKFFAGVRTFLKSQGMTLTQKRTDALEFLIGKFEGVNWTIPQVSYALATIYHETAHTFDPIYEYGPKSYFNKYEPGTRIGKNLGNIAQGDGYLYRGAGYVQITGRSNYRKFGIENNPQSAINPDMAFRILKDGMQKGMFTGKKLPDYISDTGKDYKNARKIINGTDKAALIAGYANQFEEILRSSKVSAQVPQEAAKNKEEISTPLTPSDTLAPTTTPLIQAPTIAVEAVVAAPTEEAPKEDTLTKIGNKVAAAWAAAGAAVIGIGTWLSSTPQGIATAIVIAVAVIGGIYMLVNALRQNAKDKRDAANKLREDELKLEREKMAHETQLYLLKSAADPGLNAVKIVPPAQELANSDTEVA